jgi:hypothetical protein
LEVPQIRSRSIFVFSPSSHPYAEKVRPNLIRKKPYRSYRKFPFPSLPSDCSVVFGPHPVFSSRIAREQPNTSSEMQIWPKGRNAPRSSPHGKDATHEQESRGHWWVNTKDLKGNCQATAWSKGIPRCSSNVISDPGEKRPNRTSVSLDDSHWRC